MERKEKVRIFFIKILKILVSPASRIRKFVRKFNLKQIKIIASICAIIISTALVIYLYRLFINVTQNRIERTTTPFPRGTPMMHVPLDEIYPDLKLKVNKTFIIDDEQIEPVGMLNTNGCKIPLAMLDYEKFKPRNKNNKTFTCGTRAVFLQKHGDDAVIARIKPTILKKLSKADNSSFDCCYKFLVDYYIKHEKYPENLIYTNCTIFHDDTIITLQSDFIQVICFEIRNNISHILYEDMYAFNKKIVLPKPAKTSCKFKYNVLILGMDSMSLPRFVKTMRRSTSFLDNNNWLGFRGYHKIDDTSLPNILALLTGKNMSSIAEQCSKSMDDCNDFIIWTAFREAGYVTAYGEDEHLKKTFVQKYKFNRPPTDHYMEPFFLKRDSMPKQSMYKFCTGTVISGQQILDYALDFANTYKRDAFFGFFWINSLSSHERSRLGIADKIIENFLNQLAYTGVLKNTFVMLLSSHGLRNGKLRLKMEGYYDERMPMNFLWVPLIFKGQHPYKLRALLANQHRLVTPYDIYSTLKDLKKISLCTNSSSEVVAEGCLNCQSVFDVISDNRTCVDVNIHPKWCSCHKLYPLPIQDPIGEKSVEAVVNYFKEMVAQIKTQRCWRCKTPSLKNTHRIHFYFDTDKISIFYVVAINLEPGNRNYEVTVLRKDGYRIIGPLSIISSYDVEGNCALRKIDRQFCSCEKIPNC